MSTISIYKTTSKVLIILIALSSMNVWGDIKTKQEISSEAKSKAPHISSQQLSSYLSGKEDFILLDIRTEAEYQAGHIQGIEYELACGNFGTWDRSRFNR